MQTMTAKVSSFMVPSKKGNGRKSPFYCPPSAINAHAPEYKIRKKKVQ
jgi:predicted small lipoprotein YifL